MPTQAVHRIRTCRGARSATSTARCTASIIAENTHSQIAATMPAP